MYIGVISLQGIVENASLCSKIFSDSSNDPQNNKWTLNQKKKIT